MKKLAFDSSNWKLIGTINDLIDLVNSQQEAIGELQTEIGVLRNMVLQSQEAIERLQEHVDHEARHVSEPADDKPDTHRTVTLRIPKGMRVGEAIRQVWMEAANSGYLGSVSDTDLQKALDEVQPNE